LNRETMNPTNETAPSKPDCGGVAGGFLALRNWRLNS
jgi:hypothetical protein